jgi:hypothetical protein
MFVEELKSTVDLKRVQKQMRRRVVKLKLEGSEVQITYTGGMFKARLAGASDAAFGQTPSEATQRLSKIEAMKSVCLPKQCDVAADRAERRCTL